MDAVATPFVQGRLWNTELSVVVETECAHCSKKIHLEMDKDLNCKARETDADPIGFLPIVNFKKLKEPSIIDVF